MKRKPGRPKLPKGEAKGKIVPIRLSHVTAKTVVAYWLSHKLGPDRLSRACSRNGSSPRDVTAKRQQLPRQ